MSLGILIPFGNRCCRSHLDDAGNILDNELNNITIYCENIEIDSRKLLLLFESIRKYYSSTCNLFSRFEKMLLIDNKLCYDHTGFTKDEFFFIFNELKSLNNSPSRSKEQALAIYLTWLRTGLPQETLAAFFGVNSRQSISDYCEQVRKAFEKDFIKTYMGADHCSRDQWLEKNTVLVNELYDLKNDQFCIIADGTYIYCQKSSNNKIQKVFYSVQKKRSLIKPFIMCTSNGYIIDIFGPFAATENDASIILKILDSNIANIMSIIKKK